MITLEFDFLSLSLGAIDWCVICYLVRFLIIRAGFVDALLRKKKIKDGYVIFIVSFYHTLLW